MNIKKYKDIIEQILKKDDRLWNKDKTEFNKALLFNLIVEMDETIIGLLLEEDATREKFFIKIKNAYVFKTKEFKFFIDEHKVFNSYTSYPNRIGLSDGKEFIMDRNDVVLNFPFKDCILEGGQSTEEGIDAYFEYDEKLTKTQEKQGWKSASYNEKQGERQEIFYNEILAEDEIDRLYDKKALVNWRRYTKNGEEKVEEIKRDENGLIRENLLIKGNNLLALHSLKSQFAGKIRMIYIDPPYGTGSDSFAYNDKFNRSTWLTFMKNRLEIAKELLSNDGVILIQISFHQYPYLRVLADEIFTEACHQFDMNTLVRHPERSLTSDKEFNDVVEYTLIYSKSPDFKMPKQEIEKTDEDYQYDILLPDKPDEEIVLGGKEVKVYYPKRVTINRSEGHLGGLKSMSIRGSIREKNSSGRYYVAHLEDKIGQYPEGTMFAVPDMGDDGLPYRIFELPKGGNKNGIYYPGKPQSSAFTYLPYPNFMDFVKEYNLVNDEGNVSFRNGKKPEKFIQFYLDLFTQENDYVLDYYLGSGTTSAVAHKMNRRYIGIEQMDYINSITIPRLINVIDGEQEGISKEVNWQGCGDFIYFELAKWNEKAKEEINSCNNLDELKSLFTDLCDKYYLDYNLKVNNFKNKIIEEDEFIKLPLEEQKYMFLTMLDLNQLYVQATEMEDSKFDISEEDQSLTRMFYEEV